MAGGRLDIKHSALLDSNSSLRAFAQTGAEAVAVGLADQFALPLTIAPPS